MRNFLVIGYGSIAKKHISLIKDKFPNSNIIISRSTKEKAKQKISDAQKVITEIDEVLDEIDAGFICSPANFHITSIKKLASKKIPIFCEKPMVGDLDQAIELEGVLKDSSFFLAYVLRYLPAMKFIKEMIETKTYGKVHHVRAEVGQYLPTWRKGVDYKASVSANRSLGGGATLELSHEIDYIYYLFGKPQMVFASEKKFSRLDIDVEDSTDILFLNDEFNISLHMDMLQMKTTRQLKIVFEKANLVWDMIDSKVFIYKNEQDAVLKIFENHKMYKDQMDSFFELIQSSNPPRDYRRGVGVMRIIEAIKESSKNKQVVKL